LDRPEKTRTRSTSCKKTWKRKAMNKVKYEVKSISEWRMIVLRDIHTFQGRDQTHFEGLYSPWLSLICILLERRNIYIQYIARKGECFLPPSEVANICRRRSRLTLQLATCVSSHALQPTKPIPFRFCFWRVLWTSELFMFRLCWCWLHHLLSEQCKADLTTRRGPCPLMSCLPCTICCRSLATTKYAAGSVIYPSQGICVNILRDRIYRVWRWSCLKCWWSSSASSFLLSSDVWIFMIPQHDCHYLLKEQ